MVKTYKKKPVEIQAIQWTGKNLFEVISFIAKKPDLSCKEAVEAWQLFKDLIDRDGLELYTLEGKMLASVGDYIIKGVIGEFYPCKPDIFLATYCEVTTSEVA